MELVKCPACGKEISSEAESCPSCGQPMQSGIRCPNCKSNNVDKISGASKVGSAMMFGVFSLGRVTKTWECHSCKFKW